MEIVKETKNIIQLKAPAKINLFLEVLRRRPDGYHDIETVMQEISLFDEISFKLADKVRFSQSGLDCGPRSDNLILKAAELLQKVSGTSKGAEIGLKKRIPVGAGLGGGSSDAAAAFVALNRLWKLNLPTEKLAGLSLEIGSDIAFFFTGGTALCTGRGEKVTPIRCGGPMYYVIACPRQKVSTGAVYENLKLGLTKNLKSAKLITKCISEQNLEKIRGNIFNRLGETVFRVKPVLSRIHARLGEATGHKASVTGSGSAMFFVFDNFEEAMQVKRKIGRFDGNVFVLSSHDGHA